MYVSSKKAQTYYEVSADTLRRWANDGTIQFTKSKGGHRRYFIEREQTTTCLNSSVKNKKNPRQKIIYARVSSKKQESDLDNQIQFLKNKYPGHTIMSDIGSGINFKRPKFNTILDRVFDGCVEEVVVYSYDRLSRFGRELIEKMFKRFNTKLIVVNNTVEKSSNEELAEDLLSIVTVFTARYHGSRKYKNGKGSEIYTD